MRKEAPDELHRHGVRQRETLRLSHWPDGFNVDGSAIRVLQDGDVVEVSAGAGSGTGSWPPARKGWQRQMRRVASQLPLNGPCSCRASIV